MNIDSLLDNLRWENLESLLKEIMLKRGKTESDFLQHPVNYPKDYPIYLIPTLTDLMVDYAIKYEKKTFEERGTNFLSLNDARNLIKQSFPQVKERMVQRLFYLTHENSGDLSYDHLESHKESLVGITDLDQLYKMIANTHMTQEEKTQQAIDWYNEGLPCSCSTFIDEVTMTYGYGKLGDLGDWEYEIPHTHLKHNEPKTVAEPLSSPQKL